MSVMKEAIGPSQTAALLRAPALLVTLALVAAFLIHDQPMASAQVIRSDELATAQSKEQLLLRYGRRRNGKLEMPKPEGQVRVDAATLPNADGFILLKAAIDIANINETTAVVTLTSDVYLRKQLPALGFFASLTVIGSCKDSKGRSRRCVIDGGWRFPIFPGSSFGGTITLENLIIQRARGGVHKGESQMIARYVDFRHNVAQAGGAVLNTGTSTPLSGSPHRFAFCTFLNNTAEQEVGGAIFTGQDGGPDLQFSFCEFTGNKALNGSGGAIFALGGSIYMNNVTFRNNKARFDGGALFTSGTGVLFIKNSAFSGNEAQTGAGGAASLGPIGYIGSIGSTRFCGSTFSKNKAPKNSSSSNLFLQQLQFTNATLSFCNADNKLPRGVQKEEGYDASLSWTLRKSCSGCSGCQGDCYKRGSCRLDSKFFYPTCQCNIQGLDPSMGCSICREGYSTRGGRDILEDGTNATGLAAPGYSLFRRGKGVCGMCRGGWYRDRGGRCAVCPSLAQTMKAIVDSNLDQLDNRDIYNSTIVSSASECQAQCNATNIFGKDGSVMSDPAYKYSCNVWMFMEDKGPFVPRPCANRCALLYHSNFCGVGEVTTNKKWGVVFQILAPYADCG